MDEGLAWQKLGILAVEMKQNLRRYVATYRTKKTSLDGYVNNIWII